MSATLALKAARAAGIQIGIDGDDLLLEAAAEPPAAVIDLLSRHKTSIMRLLRPADDGWSADDWQAYFDERIAINEFDGGLPRLEAEARALDCCVAEWLNRHPARSGPERCLSCGNSGDHADPLLPYGIEPTAHAWLHSRCWPAWHAGRKAEATAALTEAGIGGTGFPPLAPAQADGCVSFEPAPSFQQIA